MSRQTHTIIITKKLDKSKGDIQMITTKTKQCTVFATVQMEVAIKTDLTPHLMDAELSPTQLDGKLTLINAGDQHEAEVLLVSDVSIHEEDE